MKAYIARRKKLLAYLLASNVYSTIADMRSALGGNVCRQTVQQDLYKFIEQNPDGWMQKRVAKVRGGSVFGYLCDDKDFEFSLEFKSEVKVEDNKKFDATLLLSCWGRR